MQIDGITLVLSAQRRPITNCRLHAAGLQPTSYKIIVVKSGYLSPELSPLANPSLMALSQGAVDQDIIHLPQNKFQQTVLSLCR